MFQKLTDELEANRNSDNAYQMEKYMKNQFPFFGIKAPERKKISNRFFQETNLLKKPFDSAFVLALWDKNEREYQNIALDYIDKSLRNISIKHLTLMESLITTKSWWDTVDMLAQKPIGKLPWNILRSFKKK
ncbi:DNA alkylation repair protein [Ornithinibacillus sp. 16A2E]|uniref:DNA alkylation repair protein n=1 Tax=Ornithinibacillus xuwenensis TaxID=3144668 RepID=A0ABU9XHI2_9BACI